MESHTIHKKTAGFSFFPKEEPVWRFLCKVLGCALLFSFAAEILYRIWRELDVFILQNGWEEKLRFALQLTPWHIIAAFLAGLVVFYFCFRHGAVIADFLYRWRYLIAAVMVALLVAFDINGSSLHEWAAYTQSDADGVLFGMSRSIRSDEWALNTPYAFSQAQEGFPYFSQVIRGDTTDTFMVYGQPVWDLGVLFRPFHWGYLLLGASRGLSFFWWARLAALLLVSFEIGMLVTKKNRALSLAFSLLMGFSPLVQWWFAINGLVEMLVFGFLAVLMVYRYMNTQKYWQRILYALVTVECGCAFVLSLYPAWIVPLAYVMGGLVLWVVLTNRKNCEFHAKKDIPILIGFFLLLGLCLGYVLLKSKDTIALTMNTVYPGQRENTGIYPLSSLFQDLTNLFTPIKDISAALPTTNVVELAGFFSFFPLGLLLSICGMIRRKKADCLSIILIVISCVMGVFCFVELPSFLKTITLMSFSTVNRILPILMMAQMILLFRAITLLQKPIRWYVALPAAALLTLFLVWQANAYAPSYFVPWMLVILGIFLLAIILLCLTMQGRKWLQHIFVAVIALLCFFSGVLINPVQRGSAELAENPVVEAVSQVVEQDPEARWAVDTLAYPYINLPIVAGAPTINCTNVYPDLERWYQLDPDHSDEDIYNRYAHITICLDAGETRFDYGITPDQFTLWLNPNDLDILDVEYIYTNRNLTSLNTDDISFQLISQVGNQFIYRVSYS